MNKLLEKLETGSDKDYQLADYVNSAISYAQDCRFDLSEPYAAKARGTVELEEESDRTEAVRYMNRELEYWRNHHRRLGNIVYAETK